MYIPIFLLCKSESDVNVFLLKTGSNKHGMDNKH